ncbi:MAG: zinc-ribbon domain-containing protein [Gammaproteobacteria bacterium]|nr:zinc-ribbon domain-containing protein [Gammaproteobacteria bacterium]
MSDPSVEPLVTECPHCHTRFRVTESQLQAADGRVRCGACLSVFQGADHLLWNDADGPQDAGDALDEVLHDLQDDQRDSGLDREIKGGSEERRQADEFALDAASDAGPRIDAPVDGPVDERIDEPVDEPVDEAIGQSVDAPVDAPVDETADEPVDEKVDEPIDETIDEIVLADIPVEPRAAVDRRQLDKDAALTELLGIGEPDGFRGWAESSRRRSVLLGASILVALIVLAGQVFWYQFDRWSRQPDTRFFYARACELFGCELPEMRALDRIVARKVYVRPHPGFEGALMVDAMIVNQASFAQPFPVVELTFSSMRGDLTAGRRFDPDEYLAGELEGIREMPPRTPIHIAFEIEDPGPDAVNYLIQLR